MKLATLLILLSTLLDLGFCVRCLSLSAPPLQGDCQELIEAVRETSLRPGQNVRKRWGREEEETPTSESLPKFLYVFRPPNRRRSTCLFRVDAWEQPDRPKYDDFKLTNLLTSAIIIVERCVKGQNADGWDFPGSNGVVFVKVERPVVPPTPPSASNLFDVSVNNQTLQLAFSSFQDSGSEPPDANSTTF